MLVIGSDHGGFELKQAVKKYLGEKGEEVFDAGCYNTDSVDYPDVAADVCRKIVSGEFEKGILICGTGIGISIAANKIDGIRAALCHSSYDAKMCRHHNNANVMCMGGRTTGVNIAYEMVDAFLNSDFEGGRHEKRVKKIMDLEK